MKKRAWPLLSFLMVFSLFSCETEESIPTGMTNQKGYLDYIPVIQTAPSGDMDKVKNSEVTVIGELSFNSAITGSDITYGHCWSMNPSPTINDASTSFTGSQGEFESSLSELEEKTQYFVRGYATYNGETYYGESISFYSKDAIGASTNTGGTTSDWNIIANFLGGGREGAVTFRIQNLTYVGLGKNASVYKNDFWVYNHDTDSWTQVANFSGSARSNAVAFSLNSSGYVGTGYAVQELKDFWEFKPNYNYWYQRASYPGNYSSSCVSFGLAGFGYVGLGANNKYFYRYNPSSDSWSNIGAFPGVARTGAVGFSMGNFGYVGLGQNASGYKTDFWQFNPTILNWTALPDFPGEARTGAIGCSIYESKGVVGLGTNDYIGDFTDIWVFDVTYHYWHQLTGNFPGSGRKNAVSFSYGDKVFIGTGVEGTSTYPSTFYSREISYE